MPSREETLIELRKILKGWGSYDDHHDENGRWIGSWFTPFDIDTMTDERVLEIAESIASQKNR